MKINGFFPLLLLLVVTFGICLPGCERNVGVELDSIEADLQAKVLVVGDYLTGGGNFVGIRTYSITYEVLDSTEVLGHDFALRILAGYPSDLDSCNCDSLIYCVTLAFPIDDVSDVGFKSMINPFPEESVAKNGTGGYVDCMDPRAVVNPTQYAGHKICATQDSSKMLFFDLDPGFPAGFDLKDAVIVVEGICIVENLCDTFTATGNSGVDGTGGTLDGGSDG